MRNEKKKKKRKLKFRAIFICILVIFLLAFTIYYFLNKPLKIDITGNNYLKDNYLLNYLDVSKKNIWQVNKKKVKNKLLELDLIQDVDVKKNYFGILKINITEARFLFYNSLNKTIVLSNGKEVAEVVSSDLVGLPTLTNLVPDNIYQEFIKKLVRVKKNILASVSEITYDPSKVGDKIIDDKRFKLLMNDGNIVYINTVNIEKFNDYLEIYEGIVSRNGNIKGCLYLDSSSENNHFNNCHENEIGDNNG